MTDNHHNNADDSGLPDKPSGEKKHLQQKGAVEEYRLVPADEYNDYNGDEEIIDILGLLKDLWVNRRTIYRVMGLVFLIGVIVYAGSERIYYSETKLMPESSSGQGQLGRLFQQYGNLLGIQQRNLEDDDIQVSMYPYIVEGLIFQIELMQEEVYFSDIDRRISIFEYFTEHYEPSFLEKVSSGLWDMTFGLPSTVGRWIHAFRAGSDSDPAPVDFSEFRDFDMPKKIDGEVRQVANAMSRYITVSREAQTNFVNIGVSFPDPEAAAEMVFLVKNLLQKYVIDYRTEKALNNLEFVEGRLNEARREFQEVQDSLATFQDRNINVASQRLSVIEQRLQSDYELAFDLYNTLARRFQEAEIQVQEQTPVFRVHEPATVPSRPSHPDALRIFGGSLFAGLFLGIAFLYSKRAVIKFRKEFAEKDPKPYLT